MLETIKKSYYILKNNLIFIQPLLLGLLLIMTAFSFIIGRNFFSFSKIVLLLSMFLLFIAFSAGWFYINKQGILNYNENDSKEEIALKAVQNFKKFFEGVGADFLKTAVSYILLFILYAASLYIVTKFCMSIFGEPKIIYDFPKILKASSQAEILNYINSVIDYRLDKISKVSDINIFEMRLLADVYVKNHKKNNGAVKVLVN